VADRAHAHGSEAGRVRIRPRPRRTPRSVRAVSAAVTPGGHAYRRLRARSPRPSPSLTVIPSTRRSAVCRPSPRRRMTGMVAAAGLTCADDARGFPPPGGQILPDLARAVCGKCGWLSNAQAANPVAVAACRSVRLPRGTKARRSRHSQGSGQGGIWVPVKKATRRVVINERVISEPLHGTAPGAGIPEGVPHWQQVRTLLV